MRVKIPVVPGGRGYWKELSMLKSGKRNWLPVILKATAGGGGKGMRVVLGRR